MFRYVALSCAMMVFGVTSVSAQGWDPRETEDARPSKLVRRADRSLEIFLENDPTLQTFVENAYGYAVFPRIAKAAVIVGGARGRGVLYHHGVPARRAYLTQYTAGLSLGGKSYAEVIFFRDQDAYERFYSGDFAFSAQATAIISTDGAGATADYDDDVAVFTRERAGAMVEASLGGQNFSTRELK